MAATIRRMNIPGKRAFLSLLLVAVGFIPSAFSQVLFTPEEWDYGTIPHTEPITKQLRVENKENTETKVFLASVCYCVTVEPETAIIPAGSEATFLVRFDPHDYTGYVRNGIIIHTNIPGRERSVFLVHGTVDRAGAPLPGDTAETNGDSSQIVSFDYYYSPGCASCTRFLKREIPALEKRLGLTIRVNAKDILEPGNFEEFSRRAEKAGIQSEAFPVVFIGDIVLSGEKEIRSNVAKAVQEAANRGGLTENTDVHDSLTQSRIKNTLILIPVLLAGLLDGINPCAFTTLIFLISFLTVAGRSKRQILVIGLCFTAAVFVSYALIGVGLFKLLKTSTVFPIVSLIIKWCLFAVLIVFAGLSVYDYFIIKRGTPKDMLLQLPKGIRNRIHGFIRTGVRTEALVGGSLIMGILVALFELGCTGQIYFPTIAYMIRVEKELTGYLFLGIYNIGFILPLVLVFIVSYLGVGSSKITKVFQTHMAKVKLATAALFIALAALTVIF